MAQGGLEARECCSEAAEALEVQMTSGGGRPAALAEGEHQVTQLLDCSLRKRCMMLITFYFYGF